mmetsp:Transcript_44601/g.66182  ORF Transcript_44601/g.66182 Transcript_44601/m.66182 type:complete len:256 (-) Transcript_44601:16-783(-)
MALQLGAHVAIAPNHAHLSERQGRHDERVLQRSLSSEGADDTSVSVGAKVVIGAVGVCVGKPVVGVATGEAVSGAGVSGVAEHCPPFIPHPSKPQADAHVGVLPSPKSNHKQGSADDGLFVLVQVSQSASASLHVNSSNSLSSNAEHCSSTSSPSQHGISAAITLQSGSQVAMGPNHAHPSIRHGRQDKRALQRERSSVGLSVVGAGGAVMGGEGEGTVGGIVVGCAIGDPEGDDTGEGVGTMSGPGLTRTEVDG